MYVSLNTSSIPSLQFNSTYFIAAYLWWWVDDSILFYRKETLSLFVERNLLRKNFPLLSSQFSFLFPLFYFFRFHFFKRAKFFHWCLSFLPFSRKNFFYIVQVLKDESSQISFSHPMLDYVWVSVYKLIESNQKQTLVPNSCIWVIWSEWDFFLSWEKGWWLG